MGEPENGKLSLLESRRVAQGHYSISDSVVDIQTPSVESPSLLAYWDVLARHRWEILTSLVVVSTIVTIYSFKTTPVYRATSRVEIEADTPQIQSLREPYQYAPADEGFLKTQVQVLESDNLAWQTIQKLGLEKNPNLASSVGIEKSKGADSRITEGQLIKAFRNSLNVGLATGTHLVEVSFDNTDPYLAAQVANSLVDNYIEYNFLTKYDATRQASGFMERQLDELKAKVEKSQQVLVDYERQNSIVNVNEKENVVEQRLADLSKDLTVAESDRAQKESLYQLVKANPAQVAMLAQNELLQKLEEKSADLQAQYTEAAGATGPNFPKVVRLRKQVEEIQSLIDQERKRTVERTESDYLAAVGRVNLLASSVAQQKTEVGKVNELLIGHNILKREFETNQQLYDNLLQRLKDATVSAGLRATNIHVVDTARPPAIPLRPRKTANILLGMIGGLFLGVALAFLRETMERSLVRTSEDVERVLGTPALALIPAAPTTAARPYPFRKRKRLEGVPKNGQVALTVLKQPTSALAESYRALRSSILFSTAAHPPKTILVTSAHPNEGKTCTSLNLASALSQNGARVLIIDADLRAPGVSRELGLTRKKGLSGMLTGAYKLEDCLQMVESISDLWVLPAGPNPPNPAELLASPSMERLLAELGQRFEHLVLDSPPLLMVTDATILSTRVDGVVLVVESGVTAPAALVQSRRMLRAAGGNLLGVVVNKVNLRKNGYYYSSYYSRYYGSYYGSSRESEEGVAGA